MTRYKLVAMSQNEKTGPIPVVSADRASCPVRCPFYNDGVQLCYGQEFRLTTPWDRIATQGDDWEQLVSKLKATVRHRKPWRFGIVGDLPTRQDGSLDADKLQDLRTIGGDGWAYTHHDLMTPENRATVSALHARAGFVVNQSCDTVSQAEACLDAGIPAVMVGPKDFRKPIVTDRGTILTPCPAALKVPGKRKVQCADCTLCRSSALDRTRRRVVIVFPAHGPRSTKHADRIGRDALAAVLS